MRARNILPIILVQTAGEPVMGYVKDTLAPGEEYVYRAHFNWTYNAQSWFWFLLGAIPILFWVLAYGVTTQIPNLGAGFWWFAGIGLLCGFLIMLARYIHRWTTVIAITNVRLIMKTGLISRKAHEVSLDKIEEVMLDQSFLGRLLGFGSLSVHGTGIAVIDFPVLGDPVEIRRKIEIGVAEARRQRATMAQEIE